jgi:hypothetical protein
MNFLLITYNHLGPKLQTSAKKQKKIIVHCDNNTTIDHSLPFDRVVSSTTDLMNATHAITSCNLVVSPNNPVLQSQSSSTSILYMIHDNCIYIFTEMSLLQLFQQN